MRRVGIRGFTFAAKSAREEALPLVFGPWLVSLSLTPQPFQIILDEHAVDHPAVPDRRRHRPIFAAVAGIEVPFLPPL